MVNLVDDWEVLEEYAGDKQGYYQVLNTDGTIEIRIAIGRLGLKKEFDNTADPLLTRILSFCKTRKYVKISESIRDELFFK
ncbi:MAG: hypothetical protein QXZ70_08545 [Candidatus Bathyarchaeia archaeon]